MPGDRAPAIDLARLPTMSLTDLRALWRAQVGRGSPPKRRLLVRELAWGAQAKRHGGFDNATRRLLTKAMRESDGSKRFCDKLVFDTSNGDFPPARPKRRQQAPRINPTLPAAARLVRTWHGRTYEVTVVEAGRAFRYAGTTYDNLTAIARLITGTNWSGPRFFGLRTRSQAKLEATPDQQTAPDKRRSGK